VILGKKLKKRIKELAGLEGVSLEDRVKRAKQVLNSVEEKQLLCSKMLGLTYKEIDTVMRSVILEKRKSADDLEKEQNPEKFEDEPDLQLARSRSGPLTLREPTREEVAALVRATNEPIVSELKPDTLKKKSYRTYTKEETYDLLNGAYSFNKYKHLNKRKS